MPLLKGRTLAPAKPVASMGPTDTVYVIPHTGEQFLSKEEFEKRQSLYKECVWTCQCTGAIKLTHKEAMESEKKVRQLLAKEFPLIFEEQVIKLVHNSSVSLDNLVDEAWRNIQEFFTIGEPVTLKVKAHGKIIQGTIVKIDQTPTDQPVGEDGESMKSKQKETGGDSPRKPPKLYPCKYGVLIEGEDKIINCIPSSDLVRETKLPKKDVIRFFIRSHAIRSGNQPDNLWIVDEEIISKYSLQSKTFASGDNQTNSQCKSNAENSAKRKAKSHSDENCIPSKKIKLGSKIKPEGKKKNKVMADNQKKLNKSSSFFGSVGLSKTHDNNKKSEEGHSAKISIKTDSKTPKTTLKSSGKIEFFVNGLKRSNSVSSTSSSCEVPLSKLREKIHDGNSQTSIAAGGDVLEQSLDSAVVKKKSFSDVDRINSGEGDTKDVLRNEELSDDDGNSVDLPLAKLKELSDKDEKDGRCATSGTSVRGGDKMKPLKAKVSTGKNSSISTSPKSNPSKNSATSSSKKQMKQMTLFDMKGRQKEKNPLDVKSMSQKNPEKCSSPSKTGPAKNTPKEPHIKIASVSESPKEKSVQKSPKAAVKETPRKSSELRIKKVASPVRTPSRSLPPIVLRLQKVNKESNAHVYAMMLARCARELNDKQIQGLPDSLRSVILPKFNKLKEKKRLETMTPAEREAHMLKKKEELRQKLKNKFAESRRRYEDTDLDLKPLPSPKLVPTPDGLANELFGDVAMVAEFISCFHGLLMPSDSSDITSEKLMTALVAGKEGFNYLSRVLCILLQTLLQDKLAEEYKELQVPLSEIPISEHTASELVRLCLRRFDAQLEDADICSSTDDEESKLSEDNEVSEVLIEQLETSEFYELEVEAKVQILVGLSNRIMGSYSVQDYMDEKQQEASELWKRRIAELKEKKDKRKSDNKNKGKKSYSDGKKLGDDSEKPESTKGTGLTIEHFYGDKNGESKPTNVKSSSEQLDEEEDMLSAIKRRRKAAEERRQKEVEERRRKEKERTEMLQIKEDQMFENQFKKGIALAKSVMRHSPVGLDRNHNRYWILHGSRAGLYVEKGWASQDAEYTVQLDLSSSCESDSDGRSTESGIQSGSSDRVKGIHVEKTIPHIGQNLWFIFDSAEEINLLMDSLHQLGVRESSLKEALKKNYDGIVKRLSSASSKATEVSDHIGGNEKLVTGLREEMHDLQLRLIHGGLGGVTSLPAWEKKLSVASEIKEFVECLTDVQLHVLPKFMKGLLANNDTPKKKKTDDNEDKNKVEEEEIKVDEKKDADGLKMWLDALNHCSTISRLHVLMGIFESCIKWEKSAENMKCRICRKKGDEEYLLLCDECNMPFHLFCLRPVLLEIPVGEWYCPACSPERSSSTSRSKIHVRKEIEDLEEDEGIADTEHEQECAICGDDGDLIQCSTCPSSFHMDCHDPPLRHMPRTNTWKCMQCKTGIRIRKSRRNRGQKRKHYIDYMTEESEQEELPPVQGRKLRKASTVPDVKRKDALQSSGDASSHRHREEDEFEPTVRLVRTRASDYSKPVVSASQSKSNRQTVAKGVAPSPPEILPAKRTAVIPEVHVVVAKLDRHLDGKSSRNPSTSRDKFDKQRILDLIDRLRKHRNSWPFLEPVDIEDAPDYYTIITNPVDLRTMEDKCISDVYSKPQQFIADFTLMLQNAERYNEEDSVVGKCIAPLDKFFEGIVGRYIPESRYQSCQWFSTRRS